MRIRRPKMRKICEDGTGGGIGSGVVVVSNVVVLCVAAVDVVVLVVLLLDKIDVVAPPREQRGRGSRSN